MSFSCQPSGPICFHQSMNAGCHASSARCRRLSPDALTGMEANLRFAGAESMESKVFARLSAWQNWIFQRPNAVGERGALTLYGQAGQRPHFDPRRT